MNDINKTIKHFESQQKRYKTQHEGRACERIEDALTALYACKNIMSIFDTSSYKQTETDSFDHDYVQCYWGND